MSFVPSFVTLRASRKSAAAIGRVPIVRYQARGTKLTGEEGGHPVTQMRFLAPSSRRVASTMPSLGSQGAPLSRRTRPILSSVFMPTAEPVGRSDTRQYRCQCPDLSFFFPGQDLRRFLSSAARVSESVRPRESTRAKILKILKILEISLRSRDRSPPRTPRFFFS